MTRIMVLLFGLLASPALALAPLKDDPRVQESMITVGMADHIRKQCDTISARMIRAYRFIKAIEGYALSQGYSESEIESYTDDDDEKARLAGIARARFVAKGVNLEDPNSFCALGRAEIAAKSPIGNLLRAK